jgi:hypothetical protein
VIAVGMLGIKIFGETLFLVLLPCAVVAWYVFKYRTTPVCPSCHARGDFIYRHRRVDGGPDMRYHNNPLVCSKCGSTWINVDSIKAETASTSKMVSCHYISMPGRRIFHDCPDYPTQPNEKCKKCWVTSEPKKD